MGSLDRWLAVDRFAAIREHERILDDLDTRREAPAPAPIQKDQVRRERTFKSRR